MPKIPYEEMKNLPPELLYYVQNSQKLEFADEFENRQHIDYLSKNHPTDQFRLSESEDDYLMNFWNPDKNVDITRGVPADLFFSKCIAANDIYIEVTREDAVLKDTIGTYGARFVIYPDYRKRVDTLVEEDDTVTVGFVEYFMYDPRDDTMLKNIAYIAPINIEFGIDGLVLKRKFGYVNFPNGYRDAFEQTTTIADLMPHISSFLLTWYGIQIALQHPLIKDVIMQSTRLRKQSPKKINNQSVRKTVYTCRLHVLNKDEIESALKSYSINRKTNVWYVIGHWRHLKGDRKTFVHPYWKGPLKELKEKQQTRNRLLPNVPDSDQPLS